MKKIEGLINKLHSFFRCRRNSVGVDSEGAEAPTLKRAKLNRISKPVPGDQSGAGDPCHTKQYKRRQIAKYCRWILTVVEGDDQGRQFIGATPEIRIGRQPENHICLRDPKVSRFHALIRLKGSYLIIKDLQSTNGTIINNVRIRRHKLQSGDLVKLGDTIIKVTLEKN